MNEPFKNTIKVASVYAGTILGAGFASGQEIVQFFIIYEHRGGYGILLSAILFAMMGVIILNKIYCYQIKSYEQYVTPLIGERLGHSVEILVCLFMLSSFCVMVAGSGAVFYEEMGLAKEAGILIMVTLCLIVFWNDIRGVIVVNSILAPMMMIGFVLMGCYILITRDISVMSLTHIAGRVVHNWFTSSLIYVSYNTLTIVVIMTALLPILTQKKVAIMGGFIGGISLGIIAFIMWLVLRLFSADIISYEIPLLQIMMKQGRVMEILYAFILYVAMFTTAVASGYGFLNRVTYWFDINKKVCAIIICIISVPLANMGFSTLVKTLYPLFGYLGIFMMIVILIDGLKELFTSSRNKNSL